MGRQSDDQRQGRFEITYEMTANAPPPMAWQQYDREVKRQWKELLGGDPEEPDVHRFLEQHPSLVPGAFSALGRPTSGHGPFMDALITKPPLQALGTKIPDFMWMSRDSAFFNPV